LHILLLDDHEMVMEAIADRLRTRGHDVSLASIPAAAKPWLEAGSIAALLLDVRLEGVDGLDLLAKLRDRYPDLPVIVLTGFDSPEVRARSEALAVRAVVPKAESLERLCAELESIRPADDTIHHSAVVPSLRLSATKVAILRLLAQGFRVKEIAARTGLRPRTVREYVGWLEHRLGATTQAELVAKGFRHGWIPPDLSPRPRGSADAGH
jgi:DNA-binding NarL/FixJ family response regulator